MLLATATGATLSNLAYVIVGVIAGGASSYILARQSNRATAARASEQLDQRRKEGAYVDLLTELNRGNSFVDRMHPAVPVGLPPPAVPDDQGLWVLSAKVSAFGSDEVNALFENWAKALRWFMHVEADLAALGNRPEGARPTAWHDEMATGRARLEQARADYKVASDAVVARARKELAAHRPDGRRKGPPRGGSVEQP
jgi:hypothetical protein